MVFDYFSFARAKKNKEDLEKRNPQDPVLKDDDEQFLQRVASEPTAAPPSPPPAIQDGGSEHRSDSHDFTNAYGAAKMTALLEGSKDEAANLSASTANTMELQDKSSEANQRTWGSYVPKLPSVTSLPSVSSITSISLWKPKAEVKATEAAGESCNNENSSQSAASELAMDAATDQFAYPSGVKVTENVKLDQEKQEQDEREVSVLLDRLNLSSINNRVFSFSERSQKLYQDFTLVLKDMINGGPTAYHDMEKLLRDNEAHLSQMFATMPPFIQTLVKSLPAKLGSSLGPEILAAASEKPGNDMKARIQHASEASTTSQGKKKQVPSVKALANQRGAIAGMLRSTVTFLQSRFPAFVTGTNVIMSLAVFILLFVFWYCHKRGRETRLQAEAEADLNDVSDAESDKDEHQLTTPQSSTAGLSRHSKRADASGAEQVNAAEETLKQSEPADIPLPSKNSEQDLGEDDMTKP